MKLALLPLLLLAGRATAFLPASPLLSAAKLPVGTRGAHRPAAGLCMASDPDLLVVGAGVLGSLLIEDFKRKFPESRVVAETRTETKHDALRALGAEPRTRDSPVDFGAPKHVVFCAAPGGNDDYVAEVKRAVDVWGGAPGRMVFTSSGGVYAEEDGGVVDEASPLDTASPKAQKLIAAEEAVRGAGGTVLRLAGLYSLDRGAHSYWLKAGKCAGRPDGLIGLVSYADSAHAALCALTCEREVAGETFLVCDGAEQTRVDIINSARKTAMWNKYNFPEMAEAAVPEHAKGTGKRYNVEKILTTGWKPSYPTFDAFCEAHR